MNGTTTLGTASLVIVPENPRRRKLVITNISDTRVFICQGIAISNTGIPLVTNGVIVDEPDNLGYIYLGAWSGITTAATKIISWYEENYP